VVPGGGNEKYFEQQGNTMLSETEAFIGTVLSVIALLVLVWFLRRDISDVPEETDEVLRQRDKEISEEDQIKAIIHDMQASKENLLSWHGDERVFFEIEWAERVQDLERRYPKNLVKEAEFRLNAMDGENFPKNLFPALKEF
jgi:hypothetical protein